MNRLKKKKKTTAKTWFKTAISKFSDINGFVPYWKCEQSKHFHSKMCPINVGWGCVLDTENTKLRIIKSAITTSPTYVHHQWRAARMYHSVNVRIKWLRKLLWRPFYPIVAFRKASISVCNCCTFFFFHRWILDMYIDSQSHIASVVCCSVFSILGALNVGGICRIIQYLTGGKKGNPPNRHVYRIQYT